MTKKLPRKAKVALGCLQYKKLLKTLKLPSTIYLCLGPDVKEIFTTLTEIGDATNYASVVELSPGTGKLSIRPSDLSSENTNPGKTVQQFVSRLIKESS